MGTYADWRALNCAIHNSEKWRAADDAARVLWIQLLARCDNYGAIEGDPHVIWTMCSKRLGWTAAKSARALRTLVKVDLVHVWEEDGSDWVHIVDFDRHQHPEFLRKRGRRRSPEHDCSTVGRTKGRTKGRPHTDTNTDTDTDTDTDPAAARTSDVEAAFAHWKALEEGTVGKSRGGAPIPGIRNPRLTAERRKHLNARLAVYSLADVQDAISGYLADPWFLGANDSDRRFTDIVNILANDTKLERGRAKHHQSQARSAAASAPGPGGSLVRVAARAGAEA